MKYALHVKYSVKDYIYEDTFMNIDDFTVLDGVLSGFETVNCVQKRTVVFACGTYICAWLQEDDE